MSRDYWSPPGGWQYLEDYLPEGRHGFSDDYHEKVSKAKNDYEVCIVCGRRTTTDRGIRLILGSGGTGLVPPHLYDEAYTSDSGFMGGFMVGPECGKKIPSEYRVT
jgi:hypothetical protein